MDRISNLLFYAEQTAQGERGPWPAVALWSALALTVISLAVGYWRTAVCVWTHGGGAVVRELVGLVGLAAAGRGLRRWWRRPSERARIAELEARLKALEVEAAHAQQTSPYLNAGRQVVEAAAAAPPAKVIQPDPARPTSEEVSRANAPPRRCLPA